MQKKFAALGLDIIGSTPEETRAAIANDIPKWAQVIKDANIQAGQLDMVIVRSSGRRPPTATKPCSGAPGSPRFRSPC